MCFVETASIDGESNLKIRKCIKDSRHIKTPANLSRIAGTVVCEGPNNRLYTFDGLMHVTQGLEANNIHRRRPAPQETVSHSESFDYDIINADIDVQAEPRRIALTPNELILRGSTLQNTTWVHGLVIYTGHETKLVRNPSSLALSLTVVQLRNSDPAPIKLSNLQMQLNKQIIWLFLAILILAVVLVVGGVITNSVRDAFLLC